MNYGFGHVPPGGANFRDLEIDEKPENFFFFLANESKN